MTAVQVALVSLRRIGRDRRATFFLIVLPILVVVVVGSSVSGINRFKVGVVNRGNGTLSQQLLTELKAAPGTDITVVTNPSSLQTSVRRAEFQAGVIIPADFDQRLRKGVAPVDLIVAPGEASGQAAIAAVSDVITSFGATAQAAQFATAHGSASFDQNLRLAQSTQKATPRITVRSAPLNKERSVLPDGFSYSAPTMLVLFVFINCMTLGGTIIDNRKLGVYQRVLAGPAGPSRIILGEGLAAMVVALGQSALIVSAGALVFRVSWGSPLAAAVLVVAWASVACATGLLCGTLFRTPEQAAAVGPALGMAFGMLGGCMWPLAIVGPLMKTLGHITPQAWAVDAWTRLLSNGAGLAGIGQQLLVLAAFALVIGSLAIYRMHRVLTA